MTIYFAIPSLNESKNIEKTLDCIASQNYDGEIKTFVCINQPEEWWNMPDKVEICEDNSKTFEIIKNHKSSQNISIIDKWNKGKGWIRKPHGVGHARHTLFAEIDKIAKNDDIIISMDADTIFNENYVKSIVENFERNRDILAISVPYYHPISGNDDVDSAMLRYEIYMRNYAIEMLRIDSPFAYTALGSAIAFKLSSYKKIGGFTPVKSGEDFYFLQQLRKVGKLAVWNDEKVYPGTRFSDRVYFGTGPAMIKGNEGNWESYPIYHRSLFLKILEVYDNIDRLFEGNLEKKFDFLNFLNQHFKTEDFIKPLRKNFKNLKQFRRAFHTKVEGLRILQYLKNRQAELQIDDSFALQDNLKEYNFGKNINLNKLENLVEIRDFLVEIESELLKKKQILSFA